MAKKEVAPKVKKVVLPKGITMEDIRALGAEMNETVFKDEPIDLDAMDDYTCFEQVKADMDALQPEDPISPESRATLKAIGCEVEFITEETEEEVVDDTEETPIDLTGVDIDTMKVIAKENGIRIPPPFLKDEEKMRTYLDGKLSGMVADPTTKKEKKNGKRGKLKEGMNTLIEELCSVPGAGMENEDEYVSAVKKVFPDKPYRVIGNAIYAFFHKK